MGHKVNPKSFRQTTTYHTPSRWFAPIHQYAQHLRTDVLLRRLVKTTFRSAGIARIEVERSSGQITLNIHTSKPGVVIGRGGVLIEDLKKRIKREFFGSEKMKVVVNIHEVRDPDTNAEIIYQAIRDQLEQRVPFRRAMKRSIEQVMRGGAKGVKVQVSGRLNGAEIARTETLTKGRLPLHTLRANIDYTRGAAHTMYGTIGIKVWVYRGDVFGDVVEEPVVRQERKRNDRPRRQRRSTTPVNTGKKPILRKKADIEKEKAEHVGPVEPAVIEEGTNESIA